MLKKIAAAPLILALLISTGGVNAQYNPTGAVTNQQPNSPNYQRDAAYIDSTLAGGTGGGLPPSSVSTPMPDPCTKFPALKACQPPETGGGGAGTGQYTLRGRCLLGINLPYGSTLPQNGPGIADGVCHSESLVWQKATSGSLFKGYEVGDTELVTGGSYYVVWEKSKAQDWTYEWTGECAGTIVWRCYTGNTAAGIGTRFQNEMTVTVTHKVTGEKHVVRFSMNMYICGAYVGTTRYGCA